MKPILLIVGSNPSNKDPNGVLTEQSASGRVLKQWLEVLNPDGHFEVVLTNVSDGLGGAYISKSSMQLNRLKDLHSKADKTLALGTVAARALNHFTADFLTMWHPSSRNRLNNDTQAVYSKLKGLCITLREP